MIKTYASHSLLVLFLLFQVANSVSAAPPAAQEGMDAPAGDQAGTSDAGDVREEIEWYEIEAAIQRAEQEKMRQRIERSEEELEWWRIEQERMRQELRRLRDAMATHGDLPAAGTAEPE